MKKVFSKRFRLNFYDIVKAIGLFFLTNFADLVYQAFEMWQVDHTKVIDWREMLKVSIMATTMYLIKNFFTKVPSEAVEHAAKEAGITNIK